VTLALDEMRVREPDTARLRQLFVELEFHTLARSIGDAAAAAATAASPLPGAPEGVAETTRPTTNYQTVDTVDALARMIARARSAPYIAFDAETVPDPESPLASDPRRSTLVGLSIAVAAGEAYYLPLRHRALQPAQGDLLLGDAGETADAEPPRPPSRPASLHARSPRARRP
jgi:DNA polymerase-1